MPQHGHRKCHDLRDDDTSTRTQYTDKADVQCVRAVTLHRPD